MTQKARRKRAAKKEGIAARMAHARAVFNAFGESFGFDPDEVLAQGRALLAVGAATLVERLTAGKPAEAKGGGDAPDPDL